jgi:hypothetical protein
MFFIPFKAAIANSKLQSSLNKIGKILVRTLILSGFASLSSLLILSVSANPTCEVEARDRLLKDNLRKSINLSEYQAYLAKHKAQLEVCRSQDSIKTQALWLKLDPRVKPEALNDVLDRIVNQGYNAIFVQVFYDGRILLPVSDNPTPWRSLTEESVKAGEVSASYDLWAEVIRKGRERGLKVYGASSAMNFGYSYSQVPNRTSAPAINGSGEISGETSIAKSQFDPKSDSKPSVVNGQSSTLTEADYLFIDPFNLQARSDFSGAIAALVKRQPDGILFDYLRYPSRKGLVSDVKVLWIFGEAARKSLLDSLPDLGTKQLMSMYLDAGKVTPEAITRLQEINNQENKLAATQDRSKDPVLAAKLVEQMLWKLSVNHAYQGVLSFLDMAIAAVNPPNTSDPINKSNIPIGVTFFLNGNLQKTGTYDARIQPWERFPLNLERHPMTYTTCEDGKCVANEVMRVVKASAPQVNTCPVLAGTWGQSWRGHASFETQIQAIRAVAPQISCVSHFTDGLLDPDLSAPKAGL